MARVRLGYLPGEVRGPWLLRASSAGSNAGPAPSSSVISSGTTSSRCCDCVPAVSATDTGDVERAEP